MVEQPDDVLVDAADVGAPEQGHSFAPQEFPDILTQEQVWHNDL